jgi:hypothetical protein
LRRTKFGGAASASASGRLRDARGRVNNSARTWGGLRDPFQIPPLRTYGTPKKPHQGFSDGRGGVQWNTGIDRDRDVLTLGANLEGMEYDGWPITRLIERELAKPALLDVVATPALGECECGLRVMRGRVRQDCRSKNSI